MRSFIIRAVLFVTLIVFISTNISFAQNFPERDRVGILDKSRFYKGGGIGLNFSNPFILQLNPAVGYKITDRFSAGVSITYIYYSFKLLNSTGFQYRIKSSIYGGSVFSRYFITENLFAHAEYELLSMDVNFLHGLGATENRILLPATLLGVGYTQKLTRQTVFYIVALWDFQYGPYSLHRNPRITGGIGIGIGL